MSQEFHVDYPTLIDGIDQLIEQYNASAIAIDGMSGAGKAELAAVLSRRYGAPVIHMSDFVLPYGERSEGWETTPAGEIDFVRFREEIVDPWMQKKPLVYSICDPESGEIVERRALPDARLYIIEGTYCLHPFIPDFYDMRIYMGTTPEKRLAKAGLTPQRAALEDTYFVLYMTEILSDVALDDNFRIPTLTEEPTTPVEEE